MSHHPWPTLTERKAQATHDLGLAFAKLREELQQYAREHGGRFWVYGSMARGDFRFDSDVDLIVDFPEERESHAWQYVEETCWRHHLKPDVRPLRYCGPGLLSHIKGHMSAIQ